MFYIDRGCENTERRKIRAIFKLTMGKEERNNSQTQASLKDRNKQRGKSREQLLFTGAFSQNRSVT